MNRRTFLDRTLRATAAAAAPAVAMTAAAGSGLRESAGTVCSDLHHALRSGLDGLAGRVDDLAGRVDAVALQQRLLLFLLVLSLLVDGGMGWMLASLPVVPLA